MQILDFVLRLGAALLMGAVVGLERQWRQRMAGTRTNALVSAGASAFVMCAFMVRDTSRSEAQIVSYVVSGVGFLGAGVIFKDAGSVRGLNTAATIWCSAAIGAISGLGNPLHALVPDGQVNGLILSDGSAVYFPPELGNQMTNAVPINVRVTVTGWPRTGPTGNRLIDAQTVTNRRTGASVTVSNPPPPAP